MQAGKSTGPAVEGSCRWRRGSLRGIAAGEPKRSCATSTSLHGAHSIVACFRETARRHPERVAIDDGTAQLTYSALADAVARVATSLTAASIAGEAVGVLAPHSVWLILGALGSLAAGRPYLALDTRYPAQRNLGTLRDAGIKTLLVPNAREAADVPIPAGIGLVDLAGILEGGEAIPENGGAANPLAPDDPAIILYTSGSTGIQKGIVNSQRAVLQRVIQHIEASRADADDTFLPLSSFCTIAGTRECFAALLSGAKLVLADPEETGLREMRRVIRAQHATIMYSVPTLIRQLIEVDEDRRDLASLRVVRVGGDRVLWSDIDLIRGAVQASCLIQIGYSSTETTGTQWFVPADHPRRSACSPAGYVLPGIEFCILDEEGTSVPPGEVGELVIRSPYVALGEWRAGRCVPGAMRHDDTNRHLRILATGDLVRLDPSGLLEVLGRKDRQVKINGTRVEPAELETVLRKAPGVADAAVLVRRGGEAAVLVAFVASHAGDPREAARMQIRRALPSALNPARLHLIGAIPRLPSGKVDALALERQDNDAQADSEPPDGAGASTAILATVENVWRRVLRRRAIAADRAWDEAGGDSLQLLRCVFELEAELGIDLPLERFRMSMTSAEFAAAITDVRLGRTSAPDRGDARPAVVIFPGLTGNTPGLASLSTELAESFHVLTVTYPGWQAMVDQAATWDHLMEAALGQIAEHFPEGDLRLVGYSLGGAVAYEIAARLVQAGREIATLVILDTHLRGGSWAEMRLRPDAQTVRRFMRDLFLSRDEARQLACRMIARLLIRSKRKWLLQALARTGLVRLPLAIRFTLHQELTEALQQRELDCWIRKGPPPERQRSPAVVFRSEDVRGLAVPDLGWTPYIEHAEFIDVTGDHVAMLSRPHRALLAARLSAVLAQRMDPGQSAA